MFKHIFVWFEEQPACQPGYLRRTQPNTCRSSPVQQLVWWDILQSILRAFQIETPPLFHNHLPCCFRLCFGWSCCRQCMTGCSRRLHSVGRCLLSNQPCTTSCTARCWTAKCLPCIYGQCFRALDSITLEDSTNNCNDCFVRTNWGIRLLLERSGMIANSPLLLWPANVDCTSYTSQWKRWGCGGGCQ